MAESFHIDKLANSGVPMQIAGKQWFVSQITLRDHGRLQAVIKSVQPHPVAETVAAVKGLSPDIAKDLCRDARKDLIHWPATVTSPEGLGILLGCEDGQKELLKAALGKQQSLTDDILAGLLDTLTYPQFMRIATIVISGEDPDNDPKA